MSNPHGDCSVCGWHQVDPVIDADGDLRYVWRCWIGPGEACVRLITGDAEKRPPACEYRYPA